MIAAQGAQKVAQANNTGTPWETSVNATGLWDICEAGGGDSIAQLVCPPEQQEAYAKLIVRAVNSHAELLAACRDALELYEHAQPLCCDEFVKASIERMKAAIAKAGVHSPLTCPRCATPTSAFGLCPECAKDERGQS